MRMIIPRTNNAFFSLKTRLLLVLLAVTAAVFSPTLRHGFVGDDLAFIVHNRFYDHPAHVRHLFDRTYLTSGHDVLFGDAVNFSSGSVAYRPVLSATFFLDRWLWSRRPFGYHLNNLALHLLNVFLVFVLIARLSGDNAAAFFGGALFALHPTKAEAVSVIGYRADLLSGFFLLGAFLSIVHAKRGSLKNPAGFWALSLALYTLALFSKESALVFPLLMAGYFFFLTPARNPDRPVPSLYYAGLAAVTGFYLYVYFAVFPNTTLPQLNTEKPITADVIDVLQIFYFNVKALLCPWTVKIVPGLYRLPSGPGAVFRAGYGILILLLSVYALKRTARYSPVQSFFIFWFLAAYLPVSHIIPLVNPVAHRYLYVPSIGLLAGAAMWGRKFFKKNRILSAQPRLALMIQSGLLLVCILKLGFLNAAWNNDLVLAKALIKSYPHHRSGYQSLGIIAFQQQDYPTAVWALQKSILLGARDPRVFTFLGYCLMEAPDKAEFFFREAIKEYPRFHLPYKGLGEIMLRKGDFEQALFYLQENMRLTRSPRRSDYDLLLTVYKALGKDDKARDIIREMESLFPKGERGLESAPPATRSE